MSEMQLRDEVHVAWAGADHPDGPWHHLKVLEFRGEESISKPYWFELDVYHDMKGADVDVEDLVGSPVALKIFTRTDPTHRIIHGVITDAIQLELAHSAEIARYRLVMRPPSIRAAMMHKSIIYLEKTLREIIEQVLKRTSLGAALSPSSASRPLTASDTLTSYQPPNLTFAWALEDVGRIDDVSAQPYCVQYDESDFDFVSRLLEEEGISYHYEHDDSECVFVMTDYDGGRIDRTREPTFGPKIMGREVFDWRAGGRLRPRSVHLDDYDWRNPQLNLSAVSPAGVTDFTHIVHPGRYQQTDAHGKALAKRREQRFDTERMYATADGHCRLLTAGTVMKLEHPITKFSGTYLITDVRHRGVQRISGTTSDRQDEPYRQQLQLLRCGKGESVAPSNFRPARISPKPRIYGTQTAMVTADPSDPGAEINVGGPSDIGCVRVQFHWDMDSGRWAEEPTSCWVRVSQFFAGSDHGALWHPRVGDEVIVEFIDGDPDRPIVTGRVYNGTNPAPENATNRPTYSAIKSNTSPYNGNYNLIAFEDLQGSEEIIIHAARDWNSNVERNCSRGVGVNETIHVKGDQKITVDGSQTVKIGVNQTIDVGATRKTTAGASMLNFAPLISNMASVVFKAHGGAQLFCTAGAQATYAAPLTVVNASVLMLTGKSLLRAFGGQVQIKGGASIKAKAPTIKVDADGVLKLKGSPVEIQGGDIKITGGDITISGGLVQVNGSDIHLN